MGRRIDVNTVPVHTGSGYPEPHSAEDEFVYVVEGEVVMVTDTGEELLRRGDCAGFKAGVKDGHHLQNRSATDVILLEIGSRRAADDEGEYPDIDMCFQKGDLGYVHRDGTPYPKR